MLAIRHHAFGLADNLVLDQLEDLTPSRGEVRIKVAACGVHLLDTTLRRGEPGPMPAPELPTIPGREVAGVVDRVGEGVDPGWMGREVVAHLGVVPGGYAEQAVTDVSKLFPVPQHVGLPEAVALPGGIPDLARRSLERLAAGAWEPLVSTYPLGDAARAHADLEERRTLGKVVLVVDR